MARRTPLPFVLAATVLGIAALVLEQIFHRVLHFDDAYMFVRYAENLVAQGTYGWNPGEWTFGCTSIPYTLFVTGLRILGLTTLLTPGRALQLGSLFWAVAAVLLLARVLRTAGRDTVFEDATARAALIAAFVATPITWTNTLTGMDTTLSLFANTLVLFCWLKVGDRPTSVRVVLAAASGYLAFLVRPDNAIYAAAFPLLFMWQHRVPWSRIALAYAVLGGLVAIDTLVKARLFGTPLPLPFYVKSRGFYEGYLGIGSFNSLTFCTQFLFAYGAVPALLAILYGSWARWRPALPFLIPVALTVAYYFTVVQIMGQWSRFYVPSAPFLVTGLVVALRGVRAPELRPERVAWALIAVTAFLFVRDIAAQRYGSQRLARAQAAAARYQETDPTLLQPQGGSDFWWDGIVTMAEVCASLPPSSTVAASEYGYFGALYPRIRILDLMGLHNPELALHGYDDDLLRRAAPEVIWMPHRDYTALNHRIRTGPYFMQAYDFFPHALSFGIAIRKDSSHYAEIRSILERHTRLQ